MFNHLHSETFRAFLSIFNFFTHSYFFCLTLLNQSWYCWGNILQFPWHTTFLYLLRIIFLKSVSVSVSVSVFVSVSVSVSEPVFVSVSEVLDHFWLIMESCESNCCSSGQGSSSLLWRGKSVIPYGRHFQLVTRLNSQQIAWGQKGNSWSQIRERMTWSGLVHLLEYLLLFSWNQKKVQRKHNILFPIGWEHDNGLCSNHWPAATDIKNMLLALQV